MNKRERELTLNTLRELERDVQKSLDGLKWGDGVLFEVFKQTERLHRVKREIEKLAPT